MESCDNSDIILERMARIHQEVLQNNSGDIAIDKNLFVDLFDDINAQSSPFTLTLNKTFDRPILVQSIILSIPSTATGTLQIGKRLIPVPQLLNTIPNIAMVVLPQDIVTLTSTIAGNLYLELMGYSLRGDSWRLIS